MFISWSNGTAVLPKMRRGFMVGRSAAKCRRGYDNGALCLNGAYGRGGLPWESDGFNRPGHAGRCAAAEGRACEMGGAVASYRTKKVFRSAVTCAPPTARQAWLTSVSPA